MKETGGDGAKTLKERERDLAISPLCMYEAELYENIFACNHGYRPEY